MSVHVKLKSTQLTQNSTSYVFIFTLYIVVLIMLVYNCSVFIYSSVAGRKCEINLIVKLQTCNYNCCLI